MPMNLVTSVPLGWWERASASDLFPVDPYLVRTSKVSNVYSDRFVEQVALVLREKRVWRFDPRAIPTDAGEIGRTRNVQLLPRTRCRYFSGNCLGHPYDGAKKGSGQTQ